MKPRSLIFIFSAAFAVLSIASIPFSAAISWLGVERFGVSYERAEGSIWHGTLKGAAWRDVHLGDIDVVLKPLSLFIGRASAHVDVVNSGAVNGFANVEYALDSTVTVRDAALTVQVDQMPTLLPVDGEIALSVREAKFDERGCTYLDADLQTDALTQSPNNFDWRGPILSGTASCLDGTVVIPLDGRIDKELISVAMRVQRDRTFNIRVSVNTENGLLAALLGSAGFAANNGSYELVQSGRWG